MGYAIELFFDEAAESRIRRLWDDFAKFGAPPMSSGDSRPHVTLAVAQSVDVAATRLLLDRFAREIPPVAVSMASLGFFPNSDYAVAYLAPKVTAELLAMHVRFAGEFSSVAGSIWEHYSTARWVPHCTLAMNLRPDQLALAFECVRSFGLPLQCAVVEIGLIEFRPVKQLFTAPFSP